jgi:hypothetical protein
MLPYLDLSPVEESFFADCSTSLATSEMIVFWTFFCLFTVLGLAMLAMIAMTGFL